MRPEREPRIGKVVNVFVPLHDWLVVVLIAEEITFDEIESG